MIFFIDDFILLINELTAQLIVGYFNLDQMLPKSVTKVDALIQSFNLSQRSRYSTHMHREILDLVFETSNSNTASSLPSPIGDNFEFFLQI